ncbi:hypothetical protein Curi_c14780 [Gottschalkia acidurici 9a]|uniref:Uncharacterized protein n=1 Tax=Gottschalkia acidurici (strain ATCC 7906 / DSM 604 / BCRC 14475 / CIP 104303 / KCTC 5404 / NCIMB 10678 / 9a) TaxID=1128398 RepID=K0AXE4_GOTA9|nr:hypothetical protein [Gottschalkia acidurici]AFS78488.1 hypothetical protein Curi_c14780 [Gottschalkia acidurici 9a]
MEKNHKKSIIFISIFVIGLIILMKSINLGEKEVSNIVSISGGSVDTAIYLIYLEKSIEKYRLIGSILSVLGGLGIIINKSVKSI